MVGDQNHSEEHLLGAREEEAKTSGEEQWRRVGMSGSLRRSEEMTQSNSYSPRGSALPFECQRGRLQLKPPRMKRFLEEGEKELVMPFVGKKRIGGA